MKKKWLRGLLTAMFLAAVLSVSAFAAMSATGVGYVTTDGGLWLREGPGSEHSTLDCASQWDYVVVYGTSGDWYLVNYNMTIGYMKKDYICFTDRENILLGDGVVDDVQVNLRSLPDTSGSIVTTMSRGETAWIIGINDGWYKVEYDGLTGYVRSDLLELSESPIYNSAGYSVSSSSSYSYTTVSAGQAIVDYAKKFLGTPYVWGGSSPSGFDCSGFCQYVYKQMGYSINRVAADQMNNGYAVSLSEAQPGDLIFFSSYAGGTAGHVGIYVGDGCFIHAPQSGDVVKISNLYTTGYGSRICGLRRIV